jgi:signal transduction histidine kinase
MDGCYLMETSTSTPRPTFAIAPVLRDLCRILETPPQNGLFMEAVLNCLRAMGFDRARHYGTAKDYATNQLFLVLINAHPPHAHPPELIGMMERCEQSTLSILGHLTRPQSADVNTLPPNVNPEWIDQLQLRRRAWVEIPLLANGKLFGLLAADWLGSENDLSDSDLSLLNAFGTMVGSHLALTLSSQRAATRSLRQLRHLARPTATPDDLLPKALRHFTTVLDAAIAAIFAYDWRTDSLTKIHELSNPRKSLLLDVYPEDYEPGASFTGQAWTKRQYRYIPDLEAFQVAHARDARRDSINRHARILKAPVKTAMFARVGHSHLGYLLRFINRSDDSRLPFLEERFLLDRLASELTTALHDLVARQRLSYLQLVAQTAAAQPGDPRALLPIITRALSHEHIEDYAILCHNASTPGIAFHHFAGPELKHWIFDPSKNWEGYRLYTRAIESDHPSLIDLTRFSGIHDQSSLAGFLHHRRFRAVLAFPVKSIDTTGVLLLPIHRTASDDHIQNLINQLTNPGAPLWDIFNTVIAYTQLVVSAQQAAVGHLTLRGAQRVIGYLGHEVGNPLAKLGSAATSAVITARDVLRTTTTSDADGSQALISQMDDWYSRVQDIRNQLGSMLMLAPMVAKETRGELQVHFRPRLPVALLHLAANQAHEELTELERPRYAIVIDDACQDLPRVICDGDLLVAMFLNLMRNGIKYSLPRYYNQPMIIRVTGQLQADCMSFQVTNWGIGIPSDQFEEIFGPFTRGAVKDERKAIRGMGLGLFLTRRIMMAHRGLAYCKSSRFTLNDSRRAQRWEGFETVFEIRLPLDLEPGTQTCVLEGW